MLNMKYFNSYYYLSVSWFNSRCKRYLFLEVYLCRIEEVSL